MLVLLSPSKDIKLRSNEAPNLSTRPIMLESTKTLVDVMRGKSIHDVMKLMKISHKLAQLTVDRFEQFELQNSNHIGASAIFTFNGDVYRQFGIEDFNAKELGHAQSTIRIISGLYGILKPLDLMQPYRLEMGIRLQTSSAKTLYQFWGDKLALAINDDLADHSSKVIINLASKEYSRAVPQKALQFPLINITFENKSKGMHKVIGFHAKRARGKMARWIVKNNITSPDELRDFSDSGYKFSKNSSTASNFTFKEA